MYIGEFMRGLYDNKEFNSSLPDGWTLYDIDEYSLNNTVQFKVVHKITEADGQKVRDILDTLDKG